MTNIGRVATLLARVMTYILLLAVSNTAFAQADDSASPRCGKDGELPCYLTAEHWEFVQRQIKALKEERDQLKDRGSKSDSGRIEALEAQIKLLQDQKGGSTQAPPGQPSPQATTSYFGHGPHAGWHWAVLAKGETVFFMPGEHHWAGLVAVEGTIRYVANYHFSGEFSFFVGVHPAYEESVQGEGIAPFALGGRVAIGAFWERGGFSVGPQLTAISETEENEGMLLLVTLPIAGELVLGNFCGSLSVGPALFTEESGSSGMWVGIGLGGCGHIPD